MWWVWWGLYQQKKQSAVEYLHYILITWRVSRLNCFTDHSVAPLVPTSRTSSCTNCSRSDDDQMNLTLCKLALANLHRSLECNLVTAS